MKSTLGIVLMICSPFLIAGVILAAARYNRWRYERAVEERNAKLKRYGLTPFPGTRARS